MAPLARRMLTALRAASGDPVAALKYE